MKKWMTLRNKLIKNKNNYKKVIISEKKHIIKCVKDKKKT